MRILFAVLAAAPVWGMATPVCAGPGDGWTSDVAIQTSAPSGKDNAPCEAPPGSVNGGVVRGKPLTLDASLAEIRRASPEVRRAGLETRARAAEAKQAGRPLNPAIAVEVEDFAGTGSLAGFDDSETTIALEQTFRLGGKRRLSERAARARQALASAECGVVLREAERQAALLFHDLEAAAEHAELEREAAALADELAGIAAKRVEAGAAAPPELARARADAAVVHAAAIAAEANVDKRRYELAALWGASEPVFGVPRTEAAGLERAAGGDLTANPRLQAARAQKSAFRALKDLERSRAWPDLTVSAGVKHFEGIDENAFVVGLSVPLPIFDRNRDAARAAALRAQSAELSREATYARLLSRQRSLIAGLKAAEARLEKLETGALPAAREAYDASLKGYRIGKFDLTTTLDARKELIAAGKSVIEARLAVHTLEIRLRSLIGAAPFDGAQ